MKKWKTGQGKKESREASHSRIAFVVAVCATFDALLVGCSESLEGW